MSALIAAAKRPSIVLNAMGQESGFWAFTPASAKNALERENAFVLSAAGQVSFRFRHSQTDQPVGPWRDPVAAVLIRYGACWGEPAAPYCPLQGNS